MQRCICTRCMVDIDAREPGGASLGLSPPVCLAAAHVPEAAQIGKLSERTPTKPKTTTARHVNAPLSPFQTLRCLLTQRAWPRTSAAIAFSRYLRHKLSSLALLKFFSPSHNGCLPSSTSLAIGSITTPALHTRPGPAQQLLRYDSLCFVPFCQSSRP